jgi:hypothetical protein
MVQEAHRDHNMESKDHNEERKVHRDCFAHSKVRSPGSFAVGSSPFSTDFDQRCIASQNSPLAFRIVVSL